ncbi:MAG TPA: choice-of-anchor D domain-containing protein, partial [Prosthecobacter sp.]|nr:choice-of-anchor D domain-containing protein [Prosthecobacter sp.]
MNRSLPALRRIALGLLAGFTLASPALGAGDLDTNFNPNVYLNNIGFGGASGIPYACAVQRDNKIIIAGYFDTVGGVARNSMARLNTDGSVDSGFDPSPNGLVTTVLVQPDGKILVKGLFTTIAGVSCTNFARLNADGTFDTGFTSPTVNFDIYGIGLQPDGKIVIGGYFTSVNSTTRNRIARLNSDGSLDTGFNPNANGTVGSVFVQADGKIIVSGAFTTVGGVARTRFARLNSDGTLDTGFVPASGTAQPSAVAVQANGKVIFADSSFYPQLNRLNADGSVDTGFAPPVLEGPGFTDSYGVYGLTVQADGKILVSGGFLYADSAANRWIIRLASNGALDSSFAPDNYYSYGGYLNGATLQQNGGVLIFGSLQNVGITTRNGMARLSNDAATETLTVPSSSRVEWLRGGSTPEAEWVGFELSTNGGSSWSFLGSGTRITGGWELTGLSLPSDGLVRARAQARTNGSSSLIETVVPFPGEIAVRGNNVDIADGDTTPSVTDYTELEPVGVTGGTGSRLFTIANVGGRALTISGLSISGTHAADFSVGSPPGTPLAAHSTWSFSVNFNPSALGTRSATVTITSDDPDEGTFEFDIQGEGIEPEINIKGNSVTIADGDTTPSTGDHTDFGVTSSGAGAVVRTFTIENTGVNDLVISNMWMNDFSSEFVLGGISFPATVAPSSSTTFTVTFKPSGAGTRSSTVQVFSNDGDEGDPYDFKVQGFSDPEIDILGNGISIADGDTTPSTSDHTDLGMPAVSGGSVVQIFTIQNTGTTDLIVSNLASTGTHWWNFTTGGLSLPAVVAPSSSTTFTVTFTPSAAGLRTASILVYSNDGNEGNFYDFAVQGIAGPEMNVQGNSTTIVDSDSTPDAADHTEFGSVSVASGTLSRTFTIQNTSTL